jgi:hypothetical protein
MSYNRPQRIKVEYLLQAANSRTSLSFPHASSGNPGGIRTGPPIKHSAVTILGSRISSPQRQFSKKGQEEHEERVMSHNAE